LQNGTTAPAAEAEMAKEVENYVRIEKFREKPNFTVVKIQKRLKGSD